MSKRREGRRKPEIKEEGEPNIPLELTVRPQWLAWCIESREGKPTKVPYSPITGRRASTSNPRAWGTYAQALAFREARGMDGVIDLDHCRDPETGVIDAWAQEIITSLSSYTEISPSNAGVHIIVRGVLPPQRRREGLVELYDSGRYFTMTGVHLEGTPSSIEPRQVELAALHMHLWPAQSEAGAGEALRTLTATERLADDEVLGKALGAKNGEKFARMWLADISGYDGDHSRADLALCRMLAYYTKAPKQIDRLFRRSGLMRWKWRRSYADGQTYGERTVEKALALSQPVYKLRRSVRYPGRSTRRRV